MRNPTCSAPSPTPRTPPCCTDVTPPAVRRRGTTSSAAASHDVAPRISYHMNRLQNLAGGEDYIVTLGGVDPALVIDRMDDRGTPSLGRRAAPPAGLKHERHRVRLCFTTAGVSTRTAAGPAGSAPAPRGAWCEALQLRGGRPPPETRCSGRSHSATPVTPPLRNVFRYRSARSELHHLPRVPGLARFRARDHFGDPRATTSRPRPLPGAASTWAGPGDADPGARARVRVHPLTV